MMIGIKEKQKTTGIEAGYSFTPESLAAELTTASSVEFVSRNYKIWEAVPGYFHNRPSDVPYVSERETVLTLSQYPYEVCIARQGRICPLVEEDEHGFINMFIGNWQTDNFSPDRNPDATRITFPKAPDLQAFVRNWTPEERERFHSVMETYDDRAASYIQPNFDYPSGFPSLAGVDDDFDADDFVDDGTGVTPYPI